MIDPLAVDGLIGAVERAGAADRALDRAIAAGLGIRNGSDLPAYTASLDAGIPGENVTLALHSGDDGRWVAVQRMADGTEVAAWAAAECLARRAAALRGWRTALVSAGFDARLDTAPGRAGTAETVADQPVRPDAPWLIAAPAADDTAAGGWTVRF